MNFKPKKLMSRWCANQVRDLESWQGCWVNRGAVLTLEGSANVHVVMNLECCTCMHSILNFYFYQTERRSRSQLSVPMFFHESWVCTCNCCWRQTLGGHSVWSVVFVSFLYLHVPVCLRNTCSALLLVEPEKGKVADTSLSLSKKLRQGPSEKTDAHSLLFTSLNNYHKFIKLLFTSFFHSLSKTKTKQNSK